LKKTRLKKERKRGMKRPRFVSHSGVDDKPETRSLPSKMFFKRLPSAKVKGSSIPWNPPFERKFWLPLRSSQSAAQLLGRFAKFSIPAKILD
jgi:hypothetical protein